MFQLKFYIILLVVTVLGPINTFSAPVTKLEDGAVESETTTVENFSINLNNSTNNKLDEISSSSNIFISSSDISSTSSSISSNSELIDKEASTVISTDSYFISGLSDLLLENQDFDRVDEIETELENRSNRLITLNRDDVTEVPTTIIAVSEVPLVLSTAKAMTKITKKQKSRIKSQTPTTTIPPELYTTDLNESPETKVSPIKLAIHSTTTVTVNATDNNIIDTTAIVPHTTTDDDFTTIKIIDNNLEISEPTIPAITTSSGTTSMPVAKKPKNKKQLRKKYGQKKIDNVTEDNDDDDNQQVDFPTIPFVSTTISGTDAESLHRSPIIVEQIEYETRNGTTATANVILNNKTEILEVEIFDQHLNTTNKESKQLSDDLVKVITSDDDLPIGSNFDVLEMGGLDMGMVPAQSGGGNSSEYPLRTTLEKSDEFIYADVDDDTLKIHHKINTEKFPFTEMFNNKIFGDLLPSQIDRDSDTIFYISNTEVKVVESMPTPDSTKHGDGERIIPEIYEEDLIIDLNNQNDNNSRTNLNTVEKYSEDIILSPLKNNFDPIKNFNDENLSISYVGESFIDIEESTNTPSPSISTSQSTSDVIIQPVIIPDIPMSIGVPVIGELPPQLDLRNDHIMDDIHGRSTNDEHVITMKSQVLEHPGDNLFKNPLSADLREDTIDKKRTEAALSNRKNNATTSSNGTHEVVTNGTLPFGEENDDHESGFSDIQTLFLACILTLAPLILSVIVAFGVRFIWKKYRRDHAVGSGLIGDNSTDPLASKSRTLSIDELKSTESAYTINRKSSDNLLDSSTEILSKFDGYGGVADGPNKHNHFGDGGIGGRGSGANGSIITMTLKNNHLIVETEERNDISRDMRETKMHYSPSEKDGVFVVECSRGADTGMNKSASPHLPNSKMNQISKNAMQKTEQNPDKSITSNSMSAQFKLNNPDENGNHQEVQIHQPPEGSSDDDGRGANGDRQASSSTGNSNRANSMQTNTGLSQSDLSISSSSGSNQGYTYGQQAPYELDTKEYTSPAVPRTSHSISHCQHFNGDEETNGNGDHDAGDNGGAAQINGKESEEPTMNCTENHDSNNTTTDPNRPVITAAIFKQPEEEKKSEKPVAVAQSNGTVSDEDNGQPCRLMSDIQAEETRHEEKLLEEQRQLGNGMTDETPAVITNGTVDNNEPEQFDSLAYLPDPPACDDIKTIIDESETNMDSLPPPPPLSEIICVDDGQTAAES